MHPAREEYIDGAAGRLFVRAWQPGNATRAVVAICHGFNSHSGMYAWCGDQFAQQGMAAYALDLRGRGKSDGERCYVERFEDYVDDLDRLIRFAQSQESGLPVFVLGHSAGGVTACLHMLDRPGGISGLICEDIAFEVPAPDIALAVLKGVSHLAPHAHAVALKNADFSRDPLVVKAMDEDPLIGSESQPFATMAAIVRADQRLKKEFPRITVPVLILHGSADRAAKPSGSQHFFEQTGSKDRTIRMYEGRYHNPLNDLGREEVFAEILAWVAARLPLRLPD